MKITDVVEVLWVMAVCGLLTIAAAGLLIWRGIDYLIED
jgi:hypothetical protein